MEKVLDMMMHGMNIMHAAKPQYFDLVFKKASMYGEWPGKIYA